MLTDLLWSIIIFLFIFLGMSRPYVLLAGVIWVDVIKPQDLSFSFLYGKPLSLLVTVFFLLSFFLNISKIRRPASLNSTFILVFLIIWITICTFYAVAPNLAWVKYDYAVKTLIFSLFIPFVISKRQQLDFVIASFVASLSYYSLTAGFRSLLGSGGYGVQLVQTRVGDSGAAETSTLSMLSVMIIPLVIYLIKYSDYVRGVGVVKFLLILTSFAGVAAMVGTHARTGLVGFLVLFLAFAYYYKYKARLLIAAALCVPLVLAVLPSDYLARMNTLKTANTESSALGRIVVWKWTVDYVSSSPIVGGGFLCYVANAGQLKRFIPEGTSIDENEDGGKAFHSIYFEALGETGYVGLLAYLYMMYRMWLLNITTARISSGEPSAALAVTLNLCLIVYATCGAFIGISYAPWIFYLLGFSSSLYTAASLKVLNASHLPPVKN